ncbi:DUF1553 domain-containing protein [Anatilimnocola floriformis]|uniref:DUF1553 domain-containing protein n=1 Tax=Anatilimnocola floriformis TaxID=2948575 RepID=UPI0020C48245|nr:DUF1553 domain-containing protein [Anatilimnocola floriformis]
MRRQASLLFLFALAANAFAAEPTKVEFNRDIRPILADVCFQCHGPDPGSRQADLRIDREEDVFKKDGPLVVRGKPEMSPLYQRITSTDPEMVMPPPKAHKQLKPEQKELLKRWIAEGAAWQAHWAFIAPQRPALPEVKDEKWNKNPIDRFIYAKLTAAGLAPTKEVDPDALCRRIYLDVIGLPPSPDQRKEFVAAYLERKADQPDPVGALVDKLMQLPQYGEHRARYWLDAARYGDTHGLHFDNYREMWPYRDWVIQSYQRNQPFDQFTVEQLAGDLLPNPTLEQKVATGFHRCNITTNEGGTIADENLAYYARERVETTSWVWLGLTANCCVCHDHKFDPITTKEFYSLSAFFRNTTQGSHDGNIKDTKPILYLPKPDDAPRFKQIDAELPALREQLTTRKQDALSASDAWQAKVQSSEIDIEAKELALHLPLNEGEGVPKSAHEINVKGDFGWLKEGKLGPAAILAAETSLSADKIGDFAKDQPFTIGVWVRPHAKLNDGVLAAKMNAKGPPQGWEFLLQQGGKLTFAIHSAEPKQNIRVTTRGSVAKPDQWVHLAAKYDGSGKLDGLAIYVNGNPADFNKQGNVAIDGSTTGDGPLTIGQRANKANHFTDGALQDFRLYRRVLDVLEIRTLAQLPDLRADAATPLEKRKKDRLNAFFFDVLDVPYRDINQKIVQLDAERKAIEARATITHVQEEKMNSPAMANILVRGAYDKLGEKVQPAVFSALNPLPADAPPNRLGLAKWLVDPANPLTARVTVNRFWQEIFGTGIVKTAEDFGVMGDAPSHPELLDWLAVEFRESGWNVQHMLRLMLTSQAYRQAAITTPEKLTKDRDNRLLSRGPRFRMDAEMIRDYALSTSGTLSPKIGGASVRPYQPEGIWDVVGLPGGNTRDYKQDKGEDLYRRSMYTFLKRMAPPPNMETFNAPSREFSCLRRERTNTPLQALVTLNDPQFVEAARNLAQVVLKNSSAEVPARLNAAADRILCRSLREDELKVLQPAVAELVKYYGENKPKAEALIKTGESKPDDKLDPIELAVWTNLCNALLNLDEALNK